MSTQVCGSSCGRGFATEEEKTMTKAMTAAEDKLEKARTAYAEAWEAERLETALADLRSSIPGRERHVETHRERLAELEAWLKKLEEMRAEFLKELQEQPDDEALKKMTAREADDVVRRRHDLRDAIVVLDGDSPIGTILDHFAVEHRPRIPGTRRRIGEAREQLEKAERDLADARRQLGD